MRRCDSDLCRVRYKRSPPQDGDGEEDRLIIDSLSSLSDDHFNNVNISCGACAMFPSCMSLLSRREGRPTPAPGHAPVTLNVYDMYWTNWYTAGAGLGVFHSGVQVHGCEYAYGGHPYSFTGVFDITPRDERELGEHFRFRQSVLIGYTRFSEEEVRRLVAELGKQFRGDRYHLMNNNCNHFTSAFCLALCNQDIPAWVNRLAYVSSCVPFLQRCLPKEWLTPAALQHSLAAHSRSSSPQTPQ
ncbi:deubiquitinase DESI2 [Plutella xylostella]|uniref:deubiquitinase DESI2 n=1 Tax=Plutella xylostella TaxID=51655 RepID=UPI0005D05DDC|nr:deubiquitinase DESI2 [Plutella xylostella]